MHLACHASMLQIQHPAWQWPEYQQHPSFVQAQRSREMDLHQAGTATDTGADPSAEQKDAKQRRSSDRHCHWAGDNTTPQPSWINSQWIVLITHCIGEGLAGLQMEKSGRTVWTCNCLVEKEITEEVRILLSYIWLEQDCGSKNSTRMDTVKD